MSIWYFQLQSSALPTELSRDALVGRKIRRHKVVPGTDMYVAKPLRTELHVVYVMTLVLIDLRSVCVFALRNNMLNGKMCSIGGCKRTQAWHPHHIYNISIKHIIIANIHGFPLSPTSFSCFCCCRSMTTLSIYCTCSMTAKKARSSDWTAQKCVRACQDSNLESSDP